MQPCIDTALLSEKELATGGAASASGHKLKLDFGAVREAFDPQRTYSANVK